MAFCCCEFWPTFRRAANINYRSCRAFRAHEQSGCLSQHITRLLKHVHRWQMALGNTSTASAFTQSGYSAYSLNESLQTIDYGKCCCWDILFNAFKHEYTVNCVLTAGLLSLRCGVLSHHVLQNMLLYVVHVSTIRMIQRRSAVAVRESNKLSSATLFCQISLLCIPLCHFSHFFLDQCKF